MSREFSQLKKCTNPTCQWQGACDKFKAFVPVSTLEAAQRALCVCGCFGDRHFTWAPASPDAEPRAQAGRRSEPTSPLMSSTLPQASKVRPRQSFPKDSRTSQAPPPSNSDQAPDQGVFNSIRENIKKRQQQDSLRDHLKVDPGAKIYQAKAEKMSLTQLPARSQRKSGGARGRPRLSTNDGGKPLTKTQKTAVDKETVFRVVLIPETSQVDTQDIRVPNEIDINTRLTITGLVAYTTLSASYTADKIHQVIVEGLRRVTEKKVAEGLSGVDLGQFEHFSLLSVSGQGRGKPSRLVRVYNSDRDAIIFSMVEDLSKPCRKRTPLVFVARLQGEPDIDIGPSSNATADPPRQPNVDGMESDQESERTDGSPSMNEPPADDFDFPDLDWDFFRRRPSPSPSTGRHNTPPVEKEAYDDDMDASEPLTTGRVYPDDNIQISNNPEHYNHQIQDLKILTKHIFIDTSSRWYRGTGIGFYGRLTPYLEDLDLALEIIDLHPLDGTTVISPVVFNDIRGSLFDLNDNMTFLRVMAEGSQKDRDDIFKRHFEREFRLGPGGVTSLVDIFSKAVDVLLQQAIHTPKEVPIICRCLWYIDEMSLILVQLFKVFRNDVPRKEWDAWGIGKLREIWAEKMESFPAAKYTTRYRIIELLDQHSTTKDKLLKILKGDFGYEPVLREFTKDIRGGPYGIDGLLDKLETFIDVKTVETQEHVNQVEVMQFFCYHLSYYIPKVSQANRDRQHEGRKKRKAEDARNSNAQKKPNPFDRTAKYSHPIVGQPITATNIKEHLRNADLDGEFVMSRLMHMVRVCFPHPDPNVRAKCDEVAKQGDNIKIRKMLRTLYHPDKNLASKEQPNSEAWYVICTEILKRVNTLN